MEKVNSMLEEVMDLGLSGLSEEYQEYLLEQQKGAMEQMWDTDATPEYIKKLTLEELLKVPFEAAHKYIQQFTMDKRIKMLGELTTYRTHLYEQSNRYGKEGASAEEQISAKDFRMLLGKIKHLEIVQNWLYGIE